MWLLFPALILAVNAQEILDDCSCPSATHTGRTSAADCSDAATALGYSYGGEQKGPGNNPFGAPIQCWTQSTETTLWWNSNTYLFFGCSPGMQIVCNRITTVTTTSVTTTSVTVTTQTTTSLTVTTQTTTSLTVTTKTSSTTGTTSTSSTFTQTTSSATTATSTSSTGTSTSTTTVSSTTSSTSTTSATSTTSSSTTTTATSTATTSETQTQTTSTSFSATTTTSSSTSTTSTMSTTSSTTVTITTSTSQTSSATTSSSTTSTSTTSSSTTSSSTTSSSTTSSSTASTTTTTSHTGTSTSSSSTSSSSFTQSSSSTSSTSATSSLSSTTSTSKTTTSSTSTTSSSATSSLSSTTSTSKTTTSSTSTTSSSATATTTRTATSSSTSSTTSSSETTTATTTETTTSSLSTTATSDNGHSNGPTNIASTAAPDEDGSNASAPTSQGAGGDIATSSGAPGDETNNSEVTETTTLEPLWLAFAAAGCFSQDVLSLEGLAGTEPNWAVQTPATVLWMLLAVSLLCLMLATICTAPVPPAFDALRRAAPPRKWRPCEGEPLHRAIILRCILLVRCDGAGMCMASLAVIEEGRRASMAVRSTWAEARDEAALAANVYGQALYAMESFLSDSTGLLHRFQMLWPAMQPWKRVLYFSFFSSHLERAARLLLRLVLAATFGALLRQAFFGAFSRTARHQVCQERAGDDGQALPVSLLCHALAALCCLPLSMAPLATRPRCAYLRWAVLLSGNLGCLLIVVLFLANSSDVDGMFWLICLVCILVQEFLLLPLGSALGLAALATMMLRRSPNLAEDLRLCSAQALAPFLEREKSKDSLPPKRISIASEPSVVMEDEGRVQAPSLMRNLSQENTKGQVLAVIPGMPS